MRSAIVQSSEIVTLIGPVKVSAAIVKESIALGPCVMAVDSGADRALAAGLEPVAVLGDFDSITDAARDALAGSNFIQTDDQNRTDFDKALSHIDAPLILAIGFTGMRLDHELAVYNALVAQWDRPVIIVGDTDICFHLSSPLRLDCPVGTRLSLFPMADVQCRSTGLKWPTDGITFAPSGRVGTSNAFATGRVELEPQGPGMLVIMACQTLDQTIKAILRSR